ncbi:MAG: LysR substrate-binding domain-containing protein [Pseudomonadota bacterium]
MTDRPLDLDAVLAFVRIAELGSFTQAAEATGTTQSAVSLKLKRLEERLGCKLIERTPRYVELSARGSIFLNHARQLLEVHDRAFIELSKSRQRLTIGISDHVAGPDLPALIARMNAQDPHVVIELQIGSSADLLKRFDRREFDTVIVRKTVEREDGVVLAEDRFGWFAAPGWHYREGEPLPIATMPEPCGVRTMACELLDQAGIKWAEIFVGGGVAAVSAAVMAELGIAALARRMLPFGAVDVGARLGLPDLPRSPILLHTRVNDGHPQNVLKALTAGFKSAAQN